MMHPDVAEFGEEQPRHADFLISVFKQVPAKPAIVGNGFHCTYAELASMVDQQVLELVRAGVVPGSVVLLRGDFAPRVIASLLALVQHRCICIPYTGSSPALIDDVLSIGQVEAIWSVPSEGPCDVRLTGTKATHEHYEALRGMRHPGLVLFSSGSTGKSKGTVHDFSRLLAKFHTQRHDLRTLAFLLLDHIGGLDTLFYCLSNGSTLVLVGERTPEQVSCAIQEHRVEVLPTTPTFLNLMFLSQATQDRDFSSLRFVTYGAEVMPQATLDRCREAFPNAVILQKYGTSEVGTMHSRSRSNDSLWMRIGGEGYAWRVVDGMLQIRAASAMLGYLNAPSPFTEDGWFITGDRVEVDGEYVRVLGRDSDLINVGGKKVYPAEVEEAIRTLGNIADVTVYGVANRLLGNVVAARIQLLTPEEPAAFRTRLRKALGERLDAYKVPSQIELTEQMPLSERGKRIRRDDPKKVP